MIDIVCRRYNVVEEVRPIAIDVSCSECSSSGGLNENFVDNVRRVKHR